MHIPTIYEHRLVSSSVFFGKTARFCSRLLIAATVGRVVKCVVWRASHKKLINVEWLTKLLASTDLFCAKCGDLPC